MSTCVEEDAPGDGRLMQQRLEEVAFRTQF